MWIYRSDRGEAAVRGWCERQLADWPVHHRRRWVDGLLGSTHLLVAGEHNTDTVVVVTGRHANSAVALPLVTALAEHYRVVVPDVPGEAGLSSGGRPNTARLQEYGAWLEELLPQVADRPARLVAHGSGAAIALSATPSAHVSGLVLLNPAGLIRPSTPRALLAGVARWRLRPAEPESRRLLGVLSAPQAELPPDLVEWLRLVGTHVKCSSSPPPPPVEISARWRSTPCTVAVGEHDLVLPPQRLAPAARQVLEARALGVDAGHLLPYERPACVVDLVNVQARGAMLRPAGPGAAGTNTNGPIRAAGADRADRSPSRRQAGRRPGRRRARAAPRSRRSRRPGPRPAERV